jgi:hypothetical protein
MGEEKCECGGVTAPLYICRSCGADTLRFAEGEGGAEQAALTPNSSRSDEGEWLLYDRDRFEAEEDEELVGLEKQMKDRKVLTGSFDADTCSFSADEKLYPMRVALAPARNRCLVCGSFAGPGAMLTPVALGTSAAVRVISEGLVEGLAEQNAGREGHDGKERLLIFSDSRQDAAHQSRFITYAGRYDRMRRRVVRALEGSSNGVLTLEEVVTRLLAVGVERHDNPHCDKFDDIEYLSAGVQARARAWEEAPLLDDLAVSAGYRATIFNLGLVGVRYDRLSEYAEKKGGTLGKNLGLSTAQLEHLCRCLLDEVRRNGCLSRPMLAYHPDNPNCPDELKKPADWEQIGRASCRERVS